MLTFHEIITNPEIVLDLQPEDLALPMLRYLRELEQSSSRSQLHPRNLFGNLQLPDENGKPQTSERVKRIAMEAWAWLDRQGFLAPDPNTDTGWFIITRRGYQLDVNVDPASFTRMNILPREWLHPTLVQKVWSTFARGDYDTAVFQAFKTVEVAVRKASGLSDATIGVTLMRQAFKSGVGPLTDLDALSAEQEATANLFAGAIGIYKNPGSHRDVPISTEEAAETIVLASLLLRIVDGRTSAG